MNNLSFGKKPMTCILCIIYNAPKSCIMKSNFVTSCFAFRGSNPSLPPMEPSFDTILSYQCVNILDLSNTNFYKKLNFRVKALTFRFGSSQTLNLSIEESK